jgi:hypothetical protein
MDKPRTVCQLSQSGSNRKCCKQILTTVLITLTTGSSKFCSCQRTPMFSNDYPQMHTPRPVGQHMLSGINALIGHFCKKGCSNRHGIIAAVDVRAFSHGDNNCLASMGISYFLLLMICLLLPLFEFLTRAANLHACTKRGTLVHAIHPYPACVFEQPIPA